MKSKLFIVIILLVTGTVHTNAQITLVDFNTCSNSASCNVFYPSFTCGGTTLRTVYGSPSFYNYTYTFNNETVTKKVLRLDGNRISTPTSINVDEGFEIPYFFKPNVTYLFNVLASGLSSNGVNTKLGSFEILLASQSVQQADNCDLSVFNSTFNSGVSVLHSNLAQYTPQVFTVQYHVPSANYSKLIIRSKSTSTSIDDLNTALIFYVSIIEGGGPGDPDNACGLYDFVQGFDLNIDYTLPNQPWHLPSYNSITIEKNTHVNGPGTFTYVCNRDIYFKPGSNLTVSNGGRVLAMIGKCTSLTPLRAIGGSPPIQSLTQTDPEHSGNLIYPNQTGRRVYGSKKILSNITELNLSHLRNGVYIIRVSSPGKTITKKIIISK
jgi:Secretion system C-terminal sorting domain